MAYPEWSLHNFTDRTKSIVPEVNIVLWTKLLVRMLKYLAPLYGL